jgi:hypothetical protein
MVPPECKLSGKQQTGEISLCQKIAYFGVIGNWAQRHSLTNPCWWWKK